MSTLGFESAIVAQKLVGNIPKKEMLLRFWRQIFFFSFFGNFILNDSFANFSKQFRK